MSTPSTIWTVIHSIHAPFSSGQTSDHQVIGITEARGENLHWAILNELRLIEAVISSPWIIDVFVALRIFTIRVIQRGQIVFEEGAHALIVLRGHSIDCVEVNAEDGTGVSVLCEGRKIL